MISGKHIFKIAIALTLTALVLCFLAIGFYDRILPAVNPGGYSMEYQEKLFDTSNIIEIDILVDEEKWEEMLNTAQREVYYECDVTVNGTTFRQVGIRPKGNTSLSSIANDPDNDRYSFKLEFDRFADGQTCFGLDKLVLNNSYADTTFMKEAVIYDMFAYLEADASLYNYAKISVNGEYFGVYLALEAVEDSFMLRNYGMEKGYLYKPDSMNMGGKNGGNGGFGGFGGMGGGSNLNYTDDNYDSYGSIWNAEVNDSTETDHKRVIKALKNIHSKTDIEKYIDVEQILKYMAVHNFSVNGDSLSGGMAHNYYLYESGGRISLIPWDYNLSFGGMGGGDSTGVANEPIDDSWQSTRLLDFVLENEEYLAKYHEYYGKLVDEYLYGGKFEETYTGIRSQIDDLVKTDPTAMYGYDSYLKGTETLYELIMLRAKSVKGQLDGTVPSTSGGQKADSSALVDASHINTCDLGSMGGFGGGGGFGGNRGNQPSKDRTQRSQKDNVQQNTGQQVNQQQNNGQQKE